MYRDRVFRFIGCILGDCPEADDLAQETFIQVYRSAASFRGESSLSTWIYSIARNVCRRHLRWRAPETVSLYGEEGEQVFDLPDSAPPHEVALETEESRRLVREAMAGLSPLHRGVLFLACWERLSYEEMARALDIPLGTVRSRLHNALAALSAALEGKFSVPEEKHEMR